MQEGSPLRQRYEGVSVTQRDFCFSAGTSLSRVTTWVKLSWASESTILTSPSPSTDEVSAALDWGPLGQQTLCLRVRGL